MEQPFDALPGVMETTSGYTGGTVENPTYEAVSSGGTGHFEAMEVVYDPEQVSYDTLLETFWYNVDPVDGRGQFCDKGSQYLSAIFYDSAEQQAEAEASKSAIADRLKSDGVKKPVATQILPEATFYDAEDYHQNFYQLALYATRCIAMAAVVTSAWRPYGVKMRQITAVKHL